MLRRGVVPSEMSLDAPRLLLGGLGPAMHKAHGTSRVQEIHNQLASIQGN